MTLLNVNTLGKTLSDNNNKIITVNNYLSYVKSAIESYLGLGQSSKFDQIKQMITQTTITLSGHVSCLIVSKVYILMINYLNIPH